MKSVDCFLIILVFFCSSCGFRQATKPASPKAAAIGDEIKTNIPFESKEPENFQTEISVANFLNGEKTERNYFLARSGNKTLTVFDRGAKTEFSVLSDGAQTFFVNNETRTFRENRAASSGVFSADETLDFLTTGWLNGKTGATFETLGTENNLTSYRVRLGDSSASEIVLTYDENLKLPVRQELYSLSGERKTLTMTIELKNFQTSPDEKLFVLPQDYKRDEAK